MIIDSHGHVFQHWAGACGHESLPVRLKYIQKNVTRPSALTRQARDGAPHSSGDLFRAGDNTWAGLREDVQFRVGPYGRLEYTLDGEDFHIQFMPVGMAEIEGPPELMLAQMSYVGIDHCILQTGMNHGMVNNYNAFSQRQYPDKFTALFQVDEPMADTLRWMQEMDRAVHQLGLRGISYQLDNFSRYEFQWTFDDSRFDCFWEALAALRIPVFLEASAIPDYDARSYIANMVRLDKLLTRFPSMRWLLVMGPPAQFFAENGTWQFPEEVARTYARENLQVEILFPISWGGLWDYPYPQAQTLIQQLRDRYGAHKLIWGSDMPNVERFCTYRQCLDYVLKYCDFLSEKDKDLVLGGNAAELCGIKIQKS